MHDASGSLKGVERRCVKMALKILFKDFILLLNSLIIFHTIQKFSIEKREQCIVKRIISKINICFAISMLNAKKRRDGCR